MLCTQAYRQLEHTPASSPHTVHLLSHPPWPTLPHVPWDQHTQLAISLLAYRDEAGHTADSILQPLDWTVRTAVCPPVDAALQDLHVTWVGRAANQNSAFDHLDYIPGVSGSVLLTGASPCQVILLCS